MEAVVDRLVGRGKMMIMVNGDNEGNVGDAAGALDGGGDAYHVGN